MRYKIMKHVSNITFGVGLALSAYSLYSIITTRANLPEGVCPFDTARSFEIAAVALLAVSFITSFFTKKKGEKNPAADKKGA